MEKYCEALQRRIVFGTVAMSSGLTLQSTLEGHNLGPPICLNPTASEATGGMPATEVLQNWVSYVCQGAGRVNGNGSWWNHHGVSNIT